MVEVVEFHPDHMRQIQAVGVEMEFMKNMAQNADNLPALGPARTFKNGDDVIACVGIVRYWPGVGSAWAILSPDVQKHWLSFQKGMLRILKLAEDEQGFWRIEATVVDGFPKGFRWLCSLGFEYEGKMPGYGPNKETYLRFGRWHS